MSSQYFTSGVAHGSGADWKGVCEVPNGQDQVYYYHGEWPQRSRIRLSFGSAFHICMKYWVPMVIDEDLLVDIGL